MIDEIFKMETGVIYGGIGCFARKSSGIAMCKSCEKKISADFSPKKFFFLQKLVLNFNTVSAAEPHLEKFRIFFADTLFEIPIFLDYSKQM
jgi:hypothetical protein